MNPQQAIKENLIALATIAGKELNAIALNAFADALSDLDPDAVLIALRDWLKTGRGFPYPADIRAKVMPEMDDEDEALEVAMEIKRAIGKCGNNWSGGVFQGGQRVYHGLGQTFLTWEEAAEAEMGSVAVEVIKRMGGWDAVCSFSRETNPGTFHAQIRDYAETVSKKAKRGDLDHKPELPSPDTETKQLIQSTFKDID